MLDSMTIRLIHVDQLETLYLCYGVIVSIWGHLGSLGSKGHFHQKCYNFGHVRQHDHKTHTC